MTSRRAGMDLVKRVVIGNQVAVEIVERRHRAARQVKAMASGKGGRLLYG